MDRKKKRGKKEKGKKKKSKESMMSEQEAILVYKVSVVEEKLHEVTQQVEAWEEKNERHIARNNKLRSERELLLDRLLEQFRDVEKKWDSEDMIGKNAVLEELKEKWGRVEVRGRELADIQREISEIENQIEDVNKEINNWTSYKEKGCYFHSSYVELLEQQLSDMNICYTYLHTSLTDKLASDISTIDKDMAGKLDKQKSLATKKAVGMMPKHYKQQIQDNDWLKHELALHTKEYEELSKCVAELENANLETMSHLFECKTNDLKIARNIFLSQCSESDDMQASPGILELDLSNLVDTLPGHHDSTIRCIEPNSEGDETFLQQLVGYHKKYSDSEKEDESDHDDDSTSDEEVKEWSMLTRGNNVIDQSIFLTQEDVTERIVILGCGIAALLSLTTRHTRYLPPKQKGKPLFKPI